MDPPDGARLRTHERTAPQSRNMTASHDNRPLMVRCEHCGNESVETLARLQSSPSVSCNRCGIIRTYDADEVRQQLTRARRRGADGSKAAPVDDGDGQTS
jgi:ribosomal protein S27E